MYKCYTCDNFDYSEEKCSSQYSSIFACSNWKPAAGLILYHGTDQKSLVPSYGFGSTAQDYGQGFYLTPYLELAKEWAVGYREVDQGYVHRYTLDLADLKVFTFETDTIEDIFAWISELMKYREADDTLQYRRNSQRFIKKYGIDLHEYDIICGWRADSSYFRIAKDLMRGDLSYDLLRDALHLGDFGVQVCIKSRRAFNRLTPDSSPILVPEEYRTRYEQWDKRAADALVELELSSNNNLDHVVPLLNLER